MSEFALSVSPQEAKKIAEIIRKIATGGREKLTVNPEPMTSWEMSKIFGRQHTVIFNRIAKFVSVNATDDEKKEFTTSKRKYGRGMEHPIWNLTENGCRLYIEKMCIEERRSKAFVAGLEKFQKEIDKRFHGKEETEDILMYGRSRTECEYIKDLFDKFVTGPAIEGREIEELRQKYEEFYHVLRSVGASAEGENNLEDAMMGVAVEAEMQGFIYGFKVFEVLLNKSLVVA